MLSIARLRRQCLFSGLLCQDTFPCPEASSGHAEFDYVLSVFDGLGVIDSSYPFQHGVL